MLSSLNASRKKGDGIFYQGRNYFCDCKLLLMAITYLISCLAVFVHYAVSKHLSIKDAQSNHDPFTDGELIHAKAQLWFPTFAFATKHVIQLHLALLPLTMSRYSITRLSSTFLRRYIPFDDMMKCHIFLGYVLVGLVALAFTLFMIYYTLLCVSGDQDFCNRFSSEIMITGYVVFTLFMTVGVSSYYRNFNYQRFYKLHQIVFVAFFVSIMHTIDKIQRTQGGRSQAYKWFTISLMIYIADVITIVTKCSHKVKVIGYQAINKSKKVGARNGMILLKLKKPSNFKFKSGHHVKLRLPAIDSSWHPFTIASSPDSEVLEFYINVNTIGSWTYRLLEIIRTRHGNEHDLEPLYLELKGPFGTQIGAEHSSALVIGSGTGFVSGLSLLQQHIDRCISLDPTMHGIQKDKRKNFCRQASLQNSTQDISQDDSGVSNERSDSTSSQDYGLHQEAFWQLVMFAAFVLLLATFLFAMSVSNFSLEISRRVKITLCGSIIISQVSFLFIFAVKEKLSSFTAVIDYFVVILSCVGDWYWFHVVGITTLPLQQQIFFSILMIYMLGRIWGKICAKLPSPISDGIVSKTSDSTTAYDYFTFIWAVRETDVLDEIMPIFEFLLSKLEVAWGDLAKDAFTIQFFCTSKNEEDCTSLKKTFEASGVLRKYSELHFTRPDFSLVLKNHSNILNADDSIISKSTILSFCGSEKMGQTLKEIKALHEVQLRNQGFQHTFYDIKIDSYGGAIRSKKHDISQLRTPQNNEWNILWDESIPKDCNEEEEASISLSANDMEFDQVESIPVVEKSASYREEKRSSLDLSTRSICRFGSIDESSHSISRSRHQRLLDLSQHSCSTRSLMSRKTVDNCSPSEETKRPKMSLDHSTRSVSRIGNIDESSHSISRSRHQRLLDLSRHSCSTRSLNISMSKRSLDVSCHSSSEEV